jgi:hypothetical protein
MNDLFVGGNFEGMRVIGGVPLTSAGEFDAYVAMLDPNGHVAALGQWGGTAEVISQR